MRRLTIILILLIPTLVAAQEMRKLVDLRGYWKFSIGDNPRWASSDYDDSSWEDMVVPEAWENEGFSGFDGYAWYRTTVDLTKLTDNNLYLVLGYIDDVDEVFINGKKIGFSGSFPPNFYTAYDSYRRYYIPSELINRNGKNVIAVRVYDTVLDGGIIKGDIGIYTDRRLPQNMLVLEGLWKFKVGDKDDWKDPVLDDQQWSDIRVPSRWQSMKKTKINGVAWYRKEFLLPDFVPINEPLVLVLGKIDDYDETYLNGELIGITKDSRPFGSSNSYAQFRTYVIPRDLLNRSGVNTIAVRVTDLGADAGMYEGPVGIAALNDYR